MTSEHTAIRRVRTLLTAAAIALAGTACAGMSTDSDLGPRYGVAIINEMSHAMIVSVDDGDTTRLLGTVGADREERFVLDGRSVTTVTLVARDEDDTHTVRRTVVLRAGQSVEVHLN